MIRDHRDVFARCFFKSLPLFDDFPRTAAGEQRYKTQYALRRFQIDDATREAVKCSCCSFVGLRKGIFSAAASDLFPPSYRQTKFVYRRQVAQPIAGCSPFHYVYLFRRQARANDEEVRGPVCSSCIAPMRGGKPFFHILFMFQFALTSLEPSFYRTSRFS